VDQYAAFWSEHGFLALPGAYSAAEVEQVCEVYARAWNDKASSVVVDNLSTGRRSRISDLSAKEREQSFKVNDLYLCFDEIRGICLKKEIVEVLTSLLGEPPVLCNTLNLEKSSQQGSHVDALYMTPRTPNHLAATWIALEDCDRQAGPLFYYPGSHKIPLYTFSTGKYHAVSAEMDAWTAYIEREIASRGLKREYFYPKKGDAFIWHANLVHGGGTIENKALTRRSLISHFFSLSDMRATGKDVVALGAGFWWRRNPQPVPEPVRSRWDPREIARRIVKKLNA
jgi:ectoine hydroxylase-related dioxygenase (phytanoyl-CoA dioxygenase family)